ncbi:hypothetical protein FXV83_30205 [Bradyrhizobium hipponense]|uniref:DUF1648 domain-containing protein n=1 Tax=Bradyrhizobium hipponense TaxID=2605638 RepID=A0A5S4YER9_9BRAD|nr:DUF1648 domain-containing protein [Bradyrhizobium hipponense]TYO62911.1 hypothetical protein FXV83_30205 [Bradyrhizobium hipponense]
MTADYAFWTAIAVMTGASLLLGPRIRAGRIAMQWGFDGNPTWYAPKRLGLWGLVILALAVRLLIWTAMTYTPDKVHSAEVGLLLFSLIIAASHIFVLLRAARAQ